MRHVPLTDHNDRNASVVRASSDARRLGLALGAGRVALGIAFWLDPARSVRVAGLDRVTTPRTGWLARMAAARDLVIGAGAVGASLRADARPVERASWYLAGAVTDAADALAITQGARDGRLAKVPAALVAGGAAATSVVGLVATVRELTTRR